MRHLESGGLPNDGHRIRITFQRQASITVVYSAPKMGTIYVRKANAREFQGKVSEPRKEELPNRKSYLLRVSPSLNSTIKALQIDKKKQQINKQTVEPIANIPQ